MTKAKEKFIEDVMKKFSHDTAYGKMAIYQILQDHLSDKVIIDKKILDDMIEKYEVEDMWEQSIEAWVVLQDLQSLKE